MKPRPKYRRHSHAAGRVMHRSNLGPQFPEYNPGTTLERRPLGEQVKARCWCDRGIVLVSLDDVRACRTGSCGRQGCAAP